MWNKSKPSPIENMLLAMRELGKFHGLSIAMKNQNPRDFAEFKKVTDIFRVSCQSKNVLDMYHVSYDRAINSLKSEDHQNIMRHIKTNLLAYMEDCLGAKAAEPFGVLNHGICNILIQVLFFSSIYDLLNISGDCWNNNFLYRFNDQVRINQ